MRVHESYNRIEKVLKRAGRALAPHEFASFIIPNEDGGVEGKRFGREFVGQSESAIGRRLREMRELGRVTSQRREGTAFVEYALVKKAPAVAPETQTAGAHSGGY